MSRRDGLVVDHLSSLHEDVLDLPWECSFAISPHYLVRLSQDSRWRVDFWLTSLAGEPAALLATMRAKASQFELGLRDQADAWFGTPSTDHSLVYFGNPSDLASGVAVNRRLSAETQRVASELAVAAAADYATTAGEIPLALWVPNGQSEIFRRGLGQTTECVVDQYWELQVIGSGLQEHLEGQRYSVRKDMRRDLLTIERLGLVSTEVRPVDLIAESASLVANVKASHNVLDHERLIAYRLERFAESRVSERIAFEVRDSESRLVAAQFAAVNHDRIELYEFGLVPDHEGRHAAYLEAMIYSPLRAAFELGISHIGLGMGAGEPKRSRGAVPEHRWGFLSDVRG
jgi:hypothetical protein